MCGIAGIVDRTGPGVDELVLRRMTRILRHRGPDDEGHLLISSATGAFLDVERGQRSGPPHPFDVGLGNRRLQIIDLSPASHQPMSNEDGTVWITYNGEIYSYLELAQVLKAAGHSFKSGSDTEVIIHAYEQYGPACLAEFNGMWAFALWDARRGRLFCARDRFGEKPFYYYVDEDVFVFASEIKALLLHPSVRRAPNYRTIFRYVSSGYGFTDVTEETFFEGIQKLPAAHCLTLDRGGLRIERYWALRRDPSAATRPARDYAEEFRALFGDSVRLRLRSDVPVGFCLSGGLDSSSIVSLAAIRNGRKVTTFSSCSEDPRFDEREYIEAVVGHTGAVSHQVFPDGKRLFEILPKVIWHQDEPWSNLNIFAHWLLMECAREHGVPVLLNGHGGDETLAGYYPHFSAFHADLLRQLRLTTLAREVRAYSRVHGHSVLATLGRSVEAAVTYALAGGSIARLRPRRFPHLDPGFVERFATVTSPHPRPGGALADALTSGLELSPIPAWLRYEDHNSMAFSVETRQPFLDHRLVEFLLSVPADLKIRGGTNKFLLREALREILPEKVRTRQRKIGFTTPAEVWFREDVRGQVWELLTSSRFRGRGIFDTECVKREFEAHCQGQVNRPFAIWSWLNLELWFRQVLES